jgi:hypothetical protein
MKNSSFIKQKRLRNAITNFIRSPVPWVKIPTISLFALFVWGILAVFYTATIFVNSSYRDVSFLPWYVNLIFLSVILWGFMTESYVSGIREFIWEYPVAHQRYIKMMGDRSMSRRWVRNILHLFLASWLSLLIIWVFYLMKMTPEELEMGIFNTFIPGFYWFLGIFILLKIGERVVFIRRIILETRLLNLLALLWLPISCGFIFWLFMTYPYTVPP